VGIKFIDLADELEQMLQNKVDLVSRNGLKPKYYQAIEPELIYV
jgi:predicted nucleotidyltransferase